MNRRIDLSWDAIPHDGVSAAVGLSALLGGADHDELFNAWCQERHESIELRLCVDKVLLFLKRLVADGELNLSNKRRAVQLISAIEASQSGRPSDSV
jgi:hypothetical protein